MPYRLHQEQTEAHRKLPTEERGRVVMTGGGSGAIWTDPETNKSILVLRGGTAMDTAEADRFFGDPRHPTIHATLGVDDGDPGTKLVEPVSGYNSPYDMVVVPGRREDYIAKLPEAGEYPSIRSPVWKAQDSLYGGSIVLEHINGDRFHLDGVERVAFDHDNMIDQNARGFINNLGELQAKDKVSISSVKGDLFPAAVKDMTPEQARDAQLIATKEAAGLFAQRVGLGKNMQEQLNGVTETLRGMDIQTEGRGYKPPADAPDPAIMDRTLNITVRPPQPAAP